MLRCRTPVQGELQEFERKVIFPTQIRCFPNKVFNQLVGVLPGLFKEQRTHPHQLRAWWSGCFLCLWPCSDLAAFWIHEGGRLKHIQCNAWNRVRACLPTPVQWPPTSAAWERNYRELKDTCAGEPRELECKVIFPPKQLRNRCLQWAGCVVHSVAQVAVDGANQIDFFVEVVHFSGYDSTDGA